MFFFCLVFAMSLCASVYMCFVVTCWERADLLALALGVYLGICHFLIGILGQVWYYIVSIPDLCTLTYLGAHTGKIQTLTEGYGHFLQNFRDPVQAFEAVGYLAPVSFFPCTSRPWSIYNGSSNEG